MSAAGFAIAFMLCGGPHGCDLTAIRAIRYQTLTECQAAIPQALDSARRGRSDGAMLAADCRGLAELCPVTVTRLLPHAPRPQPARGERRDRSTSGIAGVLAVLCAPPPEQGC